MLNVTTYEGGSGTPLILAHGLFGSGRNLGPLARRLALDREVHVVDMRNHGDSPWFADQSYESMAADLADVIETLGAPMAVFGHSMGGKAAMALALTRPELVAALVVGDIAPVAYSHSHLVNAQAMMRIDPETTTSRKEADALLAADIKDAGTRAFLLQSLDLAEKRWKLNLEVLARDMERVTGWPAIKGRYDGRALFLSGANSPYVLPEHHPAILDQFPNARFQKLDGAGHWIHADKPVETAEAIAGFLAQVPPS
jgi:esterase